MSLSCSGTLSQVLATSLLTLAAVSCGGGGGSGGGADNPPPAPEPEAPFGLTERESLAPLQLPPEAPPPADFRLVNAVPGLRFDAPLFVAGVPGDTRLVVLEQGGLLRAVNAEADPATTSDVLDLRERVLFAGEQGLLGLAFDPAFPDNRYFYVHYSRDDPRRSVISRFRWQRGDDRASLSSEKVLLEVRQPYSNHNGGMLAFGPDGYLYIALGDGGSGGDPLNNAQDLGTLLGSLLRIDVHPPDPGQAYAIPPDNPFVDRAGARGEIYAYGLRNPFRFSFDRDTGALWVGDVGQSSREEIDRIEAGGNYGWRVFEGSQPYDDSANTLPDSAFEPPVYEYGRDRGISVIGGYVYRGAKHPTLWGRYLFSDFGSGTVWALEEKDGAGLAAESIATVDSPTSFGETAAGEVLVVSRSGELLEFDNLLPDDMPTLLSESGLFASLDTLEPARGFVPYAPVRPRHSDGVDVQRWLGVPDGASIGFAAQAPWQWPEGSVLLQQFSVLRDASDASSRRQLETRVLVRRADTWQAFSYRWREGQREADLQGGAATTELSLTGADGGERRQRYSFPAPGQCLFCHNEAAGVALGLNTAQLNSDFDYGTVNDNQLRSLDNIGLFSSSPGDRTQLPALSAPGDTAAGLARRARDYLAVNCAHCHRPGGPLGSALDLRRETALEAIGALDVAPEAGSLGIENARIIAPGERRRSVLWERMRRLDGTRMPPLASHRVDRAGLALVGDWIDQLE